MPILYEHALQLLSVEAGTRAAAAHKGKYGLSKVGGNSKRLRLRGAKMGYERRVNTSDGKGLGDFFYKKEKYLPYFVSRPKPERSRKNQRGIETG